MPKDKSEKKRKGPDADVSGDIHMGDDTTERVRRMDNSFVVLSN